MKYRYYTQTGSVHEVDVDEMTYVRLRRGSDSVDLRRDGEPIPVVLFRVKGVGKPLTLLLRIREDGIPTTRITSPIKRIEEIP